MTTPLLLPADCQLPGGPGPRLRGRGRSRHDLRRHQAWSCRPGTTARRPTCWSACQPAFPTLPRTCGGSLPAVKLAGGATVQATDLTETYLGRAWQRWSRHFQPGQWRSGLDGLESYLALIRRELTRAREASRHDGPGHPGNHRRPARRAAASRRAGARDRRGPARRAGHLRRRRAAACWRRASAGARPSRTPSSTRTAC